MQNWRFWLNKLIDLSRRAGSALSLAFTLSSRKLRKIWLNRSKHAVGTQAGERIYAIGDVHGRADLFQSLLKIIQADGKQRGQISTRIIMLGDLIDRGKSSKQVLELVRHFEGKIEGFVVLAGNHEEMLIESARGNGTVQNLWLDNGGIATLGSFGVDVKDLRDKEPSQIGECITKAIGEDTLAWINGLPTTFRSGDYLFCHAGIRPGVPIRKQKREDLLWIRDEFLDSTEEFGIVVVHGHTETLNVEELPNRINIDTAAYRTGCLTALALEGEDRWLLQAIDSG